MKIMVVYASKYGATQEIAERIGEKLRTMGNDVEIRSTRMFGPATDLTRYDAFIIGSSVYSGSWLPEATDFVRQNQQLLATRPVWLFSSGPLGPQAQPPTGGSPDEDVVQGEIKVFGSRRTISWPIPKEVVEFRTTIRPRDHVMFFGALDPRKLPFPERIAMRAVGGLDGDFRDWDAIDAWADQAGHALALLPAESHSR